MHVRPFDLVAGLVVVAAVMAGSTGQQVLALAVAAALAVHRVAVTRAVRTVHPAVRPMTTTAPLQPAPPVPHP